METTEYLIQYTSTIGEWLRASRAITPEEARWKLTLFRKQHKEAAERQIVRPVRYRVVERKIVSTVLDW